MLRAFLMSMVATCVVVAAAGSETVAVDEEVEMIERADSGSPCSREAPAVMTKEAEFLTDLGAGLPYRGLTELEQAKLASSLQTTSGSDENKTKMTEVTTDLGLGRPYPGLSEGEKAKLRRWLPDSHPEQLPVEGPRPESPEDDKLMPSSMEND